MREFRNIETGDIYTEEDILYVEPGAVWIDGTKEGVSDYSVIDTDLELVEQNN